MFPWLQNDIIRSPGCGALFIRLGCNIEMFLRCFSSVYKAAGVVWVGGETNHFLRLSHSGSSGAVAQRQEWDRQVRESQTHTHIPTITHTNLYCRVVIPSLTTSYFFSFCGWCAILTTSTVRRWRLLPLTPPYFQPTPPPALPTHILFSIILYSYAAANMSRPASAL